MSMELFIKNYIDSQINLILDNLSNPLSLGYICLYLLIYIQYWKFYNGK